MTLDLLEFPKSWRPQQTYPTFASQVFHYPGAIVPKWFQELDNLRVKRTDRFPDGFRSWIDSCSFFCQGVNWATQLIGVNWSNETFNWWCKGPLQSAVILVAWLFFASNQHAQHACLPHPKTKRVVALWEGCDPKKDPQKGDVVFQSLHSRGIERASSIHSDQSHGISTGQKGYLTFWWWEHDVEVQRRGQHICLQTKRMEGNWSNLIIESFLQTQNDTGVKAKPILSQKGKYLHSSY